MILYFTSTGNCTYVARRIADATEDTCAPVNEIAEITLAPGEPLGFVFPTYFWALPRYVDDYMQRVKIKSADAAPYIFLVATYGTTCGAIRKYTAGHLRKMGWDLSAAFSIKMPDDWTPWFDLSDHEKVAAINAAAEPLIEEVIDAVKVRDIGDFTRDPKPKWMTFFSLKMYESYRRTKHFRVEEGCASCGKCAAECPDSAIVIEQEKPVWVKEKCTLCLHCLHTCPTFSIQYGKGDSTKQHGQYSHKKYE